MLGILQKLFGREGTKKTAKERLQIVLIHDRSDISPGLMEELRKDMIEVLSKYMEIDTDNIEMDLDKANKSVAFVANIPVVRIKRKSQSEQ
ncbi:MULTISPECIES: cell division topological specificity factor MinE [Aminobacterium]|jgi:cell division topological specificity factor|uniref:cell division topological specificity factor MinE n=1 Tax=Aminobacterium TaxID=81466 RepID=UPI00257C8C1B|nr:cell division topological specificity factor MinE [Aminobacterium sp. UBA4987]